MQISPISVLDTLFVPPIMTKSLQKLNNARSRWDHDETELDKAQVFKEARAGVRIQQGGREMAFRAKKHFK